VGSSDEYRHCKFVEFFKKEVDIFFAEKDPQNRVLFRLSQLADFMQVDHSMVSGKQDVAVFSFVLSLGCI
jgi:hypothetical protein